MRRYFFAGRSEEIVAQPELRDDLLGEVLWKKSKQIGGFCIANWYYGAPHQRDPSLTMSFKR